MGWKKNGSSVSLKLTVLTIVLTGAAFISYLADNGAVATNSFEMRLERGVDRNLELSENCFTKHESFCTNATSGANVCEELFTETCCKPVEDDPSNTICITDDGSQICDLEDMCVAELIPGGNGAAECFAGWEKNRAGSIVLYIFLILYLFLCLAIICDDYFVPSLEKISEGLSLSEDVAGATFMAAGTSAPELFVSLSDNVFANPPKNLGTGTIVGSAIFNILIIVGLSALLAKENLHLNWRPLARDSIFYIASVITLIIVVHDEKAEWWEGLICLCIYGLYVIFMYYNSRFFPWLDTVIENSIKNGGCCSLFCAQSGGNGADGEAINKQAKNNFKGVTSPKKASDLEDAVEAIDDLSLGSENDEKAMAPMMRKSYNEAAAHFRHTLNDGRLPDDSFDQNENGQRRDSDPTEGMQPGLHKFRSGRLRGNNENDPLINPIHLSKYRAGWRALRHESYYYMYPKTATNEKTSLGDIAFQLMAAKKAGKFWMQKAQENKHKRARKDGKKLTRIGSMSMRIVVPEKQESYWEVLKWPVVPNGIAVEGQDAPLVHRSYLRRAVSDWAVMWKLRLWYLFTFPINLVFRLSVPDCTFDVFCEDKPGKKEYRVIGFSSSFIMSIVWIALTSYLLVYCASKFGCLVGISPAVMGLTLLAAGTSVPDTLSSVIVARDGKGDMAVANSIGSNIFDILIGLGLPWLIAGLAFDGPVFVDNSDLTSSIAFLFAAVAAMILLLMWRKWILEPKIGIVMVLVYVGYVVFALLTA